MKTITIEVPDEVADQVEAASENQKRLLAAQFADLVTSGGSVRSLESVFEEICGWQAKHGVQ
jgi:hypothetical protein